MAATVKMKEALLLAIVSALVAVSDGVEPSQCIAPLGMETGAIKDQDITASSSFDHGNVGPHHGRIRNELNAGAWCPQTPATSDLKEWIQIDLHTVHMITATETQGRFGNGNGVEYAEAYVIEYFRPRLNKWIRYRNRAGAEVLKGNINTYLESKSQLDPVIWASKIRFLPFSYHKRTVCMRIEVYGCRWTDGIVSYSMPQGDKKGPQWEFYDVAYDGHWDGERLQYGLGQLTDGLVAANDFKTAFYTTDAQGWIGWKNDTRPHNQPIEIVFEFDKVREFTAVHLFANNQFTKDVQVFAHANVTFSLTGKRYRGEPITYDYIEDRIWETPRNVTIRLHHRIGRFVKIRLYFASRWLMLSEVTFDSLVATSNITEEVEEHESQLQKDSMDATVSVTTSTVRTVVRTESTGLGQYLGVIVGVLGILVVFMVTVVVFVVVQHRKYKSSPRPSQIPDKAALYREPSLGRLTSTSTSDYADVRDPEYAVPLQLGKREPPPFHEMMPPPPPVPPPPERCYYATTEICGTGTRYVPPQPPSQMCVTPTTPVRGGRRYMMTNGRTYVGP